MQTSSSMVLSGGPDGITRSIRHSPSLYAEPDFVRLSSARPPACHNPTTEMRHGGLEEIDAYDLDAVSTIAGSIPTIGEGVSRGSLLTAAGDINDSLPPAYSPGEWQWA